MSYINRGDLSRQRMVIYIVSLPQFDRKSLTKKKTIADIVRPHKTLGVRNKILDPDHQKWLQLLCS